MSVKITIFLSLTVLISSHDVCSTPYKFGDDLNRTLVQCEHSSTWIPVYYTAIGVKGPYNNEKGIRASENSCATTFPITLVSGTKLDIVVFLSVKEDKSGLLVLITDENGVPIIKYFYSKLDKEYVAGWCKLSFSIKKDGIGYINLFGYSGHNDIVLVDSLQYYPKQNQIENTDGSTDNGIVNSENNVEISIHDDEHYITRDENDTLEDTTTEENTEEPVDDQNNSENNGDSDDGEIEEDTEENSSEDTLVTVEVVTEITTTSTVQVPSITNPPEEIRECRTFGPWVITLLVVAFVTLIALIAIGFYYLGKTKGMSENPLVYDDIQEPKSAVIIPRVRGVVESPVQIIDSPNFNRV